MKEDREEVYIENGKYKISQNRWAHIRRQESRWHSESACACLRTWVTSSAEKWGCWGRWFSGTTGRQGQFSPRTDLDVGLCTLPSRAVPGSQIRGAVFPSFICTITCGLSHREGGCSVTKSFLLHSALLAPVFQLRPNENVESRRGPGRREGTGHQEH